MTYHVQCYRLRKGQPDGDSFDVVVSNNREEVIKAVEQQRFYDSLGKDVWQYLVSVFNNCDDAERFYDWIEEQEYFWNPDDSYILNEDCSNLI